MTAITFSLTAVSLTTDPALVAAVTVAAGIPPVFTALHAGAIADRLDRRRLLFWVQVLRITVIGALGVATATGALSLPLLSTTGPWPPRWGPAAVSPTRPRPITDRCLGGGRSSAPEGQIRDRHARGLLRAAVEPWQLPA